MRAPRTFILNFHGLGRAAREMEPGEEAYWITRDLFCHWLDEALAWGERCDARPMVTFDDGNASDLEIGHEELAERGLRGLFFVLTGRLDRSGSLSRADVRALAGHGHTIGSHGADHVDWRLLNDAEQSREYDDARAGLSSLINAPIRHIAVPFGRYNRHVVSALRHRGYEAVFTSDKGTYRGAPFLRPRICVTAHDNPHAVLAHYLQHEPLRKRLRRHAGIAYKRVF